MQISKIIVKNFRLLKNFSIDLERDLSLIVGKNNCGKTSLLKVLNKFLGSGESARFQFNDFSISFREHLISQLFDPEFSENDYDGFKLKEEEKKNANPNYKEKDAISFIESVYSRYFKIQKKTIAVDKDGNIDEDNYIDLKDIPTFKLDNLISFKYIDARRAVDNAESDKAESHNAESEKTEPSSTEADSHPTENKEPTEAQSEPTPTERSDAPESEDDIIPTVGFIEGQKPKQEPRPFVEAEVFNPDLVQPQYEVQSCIGTSANDEVTQKVEGVNQNMKKNTTLGNLFKSKDLKNIIQNSVESSNIDKRDEYTQC